MRDLSRAFVAAMLLASAAGFAGGPPPDRHGKDATVTFSLGQQEAVQGWYGEQYARSCPPGLAKKGNGCLPPGQAKKRYAVGQPLPAGIVIQPLPVELSRRVGAPPTGYLYAQVDGDLVKLVAGSLLVVDAIQGLTR
jgi:hypothetical protein